MHSMICMINVYMILILQQYDVTIITCIASMHGGLRWRRVGSVVAVFASALEEGVTWRRPHYTIA